MIEVGQRVKIKPFRDLHFHDSVSVNYTTVGTVVAVYPDHQWFSVEYGEKDGPKMRASFKFSDIGSAAKICP